MQAAIQLTAWTGALVFVASLLWFLYSYLFRYGSDVPNGPVAASIAINVMLFSIFALHHSVFARAVVKRRLHNLLPQYMERTLYTWVSSLLFIAVCSWWQPVHGVLYQIDGVWRFLADGLQLAGVVLIVRASSALDVLDLAGVRPMLTAGREERPRHVPLETRGLYGVVRHPLYSAWALFVFTTPVMTGTRAVFAIVSTVYLALAIPFEERSLLSTFGNDYEAYRRKVRWRMVPWVY